MKATTRIKAAVSSRNGAASVNLLDRLARAGLNVARNQYNWNVVSNGEMDTVELCARNYSGVMLDVGANEGQWAIAAHARLQEIGHARPIHCFEAIPETAEILQKNIASLSNVEINTFALGASDEASTFSFSAASSDVTSKYTIPDRVNRGDVKGIEVSVRTGDGYIREHGIEDVALLKIDVEGMEFEVLAGFAESLRSSIIHAVQFEYGESYIHARRYLKDVAELLSGSGYLLHAQYPGKITPVAYTEDIEDFRGRNFVALKTRTP